MSNQFNQGPSKTGGSEDEAVTADVEQGSEGEFNRILALLPYLSREIQEDVALMLLGEFGIKIENDEK